MTRGSGGGSGGRDVQAVLAMISNNPQMKGFFDAIENAKKILKARQVEEQGNASYMVTPSHAEFHKRIVEESIDRPMHIYETIRRKSNGKGTGSKYDLCPIKIQAAEVVLVRFVLSASSWDEKSLYSYLDSIFVNATPPMNSFQRHDFIQRMIQTDVVNQLRAFKRLNERIDELLDQQGNEYAAIRYVHQTAPHVVSTRKHTAVLPSPSSNDPSNPVVEIDLGPGLGITSWNSLTSDSIAEDFSAECENDQDATTAGDILFSIIDRSYRQRQVLFFGPQGMPKKALHTEMPSESSEPIHLGCNVSDQDVRGMHEAVDEYENSILGGLI
jgi:hypothetical protein